MLSLVVDSFVVVQSRDEGTSGHDCAGDRDEDGGRVLIELSDLCRILRHSSR